MPSFVDNVDAIVSKMGTSNVGLVWGLANMFGKTMLIVILLLMRSCSLELGRSG